MERIHDGHVLKILVLIGEPSRMCLAVQPVISCIRYPEQNRASAIYARSSLLGCLTSKRRKGP